MPRARLYCVVMGVVVIGHRAVDRRLLADVFAPILLAVGEAVRKRNALRRSFPRQIQGAPVRVPIADQVFVAGGKLAKGVVPAGVCAAASD